MAEASIEAGKGKVPDGPMMADVGDGTTAITLPERVDNSNVLAVLKSLEAECKARRLTKESRVLVDLVRLKEFDSTVLSALLEMGALRPASRWRCTPAHEARVAGRAVRRGGFPAGRPS